jgi:8-oxo-dGTP diphosphatase
MKKSMSVVVGLILNEQQEILLAWRNEAKPQGNCWEFPGGKVEAGETGYAALCRELKEEIGITVQAAQAMESVSHTYSTVSVILYPWLIEEYSGVARGMEGQTLLWTPLQELRSYRLPSANTAIVDSILSRN